jgi:hypothetical protein
MTLIKLKYVQAFTARGQRFYYFRRPGSPRIRLPGVPGSAEFMKAYEAALTDSPAIEVGASRTRPGTVNAAIVAYYASAAFAGLSHKKRTYRRNVIETWRAEVGDRPLALLERRHIVARLEKFAKPHAKREWLFAIRHMMEHAVALGMIAVDPTATIKVKAPRIERPKPMHYWPKSWRHRFWSAVRHRPAGANRCIGALVRNVSTLRPQHDIFAALPLQCDPYHLARYPAAAGACGTNHAELLGLAD